MPSNGFLELDSIIYVVLCKQYMKDFETVCKSLKIKKVDSILEIYSNQENENQYRKWEER